VPDDETPTEGLPDGWTDPTFDVWAALELADRPTTPTPAAPAAGDDDVVEVAPSGGGNIFPEPDLSGFERALAKARKFNDEHGRRKPVGEPLDSVLYLVTKPGAPEWVPTEVLALALGRITPETPREERTAAIAKLGLDLWRQTEIRSEQLLKEHDERQRKGYRTADLVAAARRLSEAA
jgi:hypothetical protein